MSTGQIEKINEQIRALKLERIDAKDRSKITSTDPFVVKDPTSFIEQRVQAIDQKIALLESERGKLMSAKSQPRPTPDNVLVKKRVEQLKKENPGKDKADILNYVAKEMGKTPDAVKRLYYYKPKKS